MTDLSAPEPRPWWDRFSDAELRRRLEEVGVQPLVARLVVANRRGSGAVRITLELGCGS